jgi:hypothetical protein
MAAAARHVATGYALRAPPFATCRALKYLHHFLGHQPHTECFDVLADLSRALPYIEDLSQALDDIADGLQFLLEEARRERMQRMLSLANGIAATP